MAAKYLWLRARGWAHVYFFIHVLQAPVFFLYEIKYETRFVDWKLSARRNTGDLHLNTENAKVLI